MFQSGLCRTCLALEDLETQTLPLPAASPSQGLECREGASGWFQGSQTLPNITPGWEGSSGWGWNGSQRSQKLSHATPEWEGAFGWAWMVPGISGSVPQNSWMGRSLWVGLGWSRGSPSLSLHPKPALELPTSPCLGDDGHQSLSCVGFWGAERGFFFWLERHQSKAVCVSLTPSWLPRPAGPSWGFFMDSFHSVTP